ncbi:MAG: hypothetical protein ACKO9H_01490 [Planctomycetota bacterium]
MPMTYDCTASVFSGNGHPRFYAVKWWEKSDSRLDGNLGSQHYEQGGNAADWPSPTREAKAIGQPSGCFYVN